MIILLKHKKSVKESALFDNSNLSVSQIIFISVRYTVSYFLFGKSSGLKFNINRSAFTPNAFAKSFSNWSKGNLSP